MPRFKCWAESLIASNQPKAELAIMMFRCVMASPERMHLVHNTRKYTVVQGMAEIMSYNNGTPKE